MSIKPPSKMDYVTATPTILSTVARYAIHGSPHPKISLQDMIQASLFNRFVGASLLPSNEQSSYEARMSFTFSPSVTVRAVSIEPEPPSPGTAHHYGGELDHPTVRPAPVPAYFLTPKKKKKTSSSSSSSSAKGPVILYFHGGGYGRGDPTGGGISNALANRLGAEEVCTIDYRLGGTAPFPAAVQDCLTAYLFLRRRLAASEIVLAGESAGAGLVLALLLHLRDVVDRHDSSTTTTSSSSSSSLPRAAILLSPLVQTEDLTAGSFAKFDGFDFITTAGLRDVVRDYTSLRPGSRYIQLLRNSFAGLPPLFISYGDAEILGDDCRLLCERARRDGVTVVEDVGVAKVHVWVALPREQVLARPVWDKMREFCRLPRPRL